MDSESDEESDSDSNSDDEYELIDDVYPADDTDDKPEPKSDSEDESEWKIVSNESTDQTKRPFECDTCGERYRYEASLNAHKRIEHQGVYFLIFFTILILPKIDYAHTVIFSVGDVEKSKHRIECAICSKRFLSDSAFELHKLMHAKAKQGNYQ